MSGYLTPEELEEMERAGMLGAATPKSAPAAPPPQARGGEGERTPTPTVESLARGAAQGISGGWLDEASAWLGEKVPVLDQKDDFDLFSSPAQIAYEALHPEERRPRRSYEEIRDELRGRNKRAAEDNPKTYVAGEIAGDLVASRAIPGGASAARRSSLFGGDAVRRMGGTFLAGAGASEQEGAGMVEDALVTTALGETFRGAAKGVGAAYRATGADKLVDRGAATMSKKLKHFAHESALKAAGAIQNNLQKLTDDRQQRIGRRLLDEGVVGWTTGKRAVEKSAQELRQRSGEEMGNILETADILSDKGVNWESVARRLTSFHNSLDPVSKSTVAPAISQMLDAIAEAEERGGGFKMLHKMSSTMRQAFGKHIPEAAYDDALENRATQLVRNELEEQLVPALEDFGKAYGNPRDMKRFWKSAVGGSEAGIVGQDLGRRGVARELGNRTPSATDYVSGAAALASGASPTAAVLTALGNMILRTRGRSAVAKGSDKLSGYVKESLSSDLNAFPDKLAKYGPLFARELQRGGESGLWALDQSLMQFDEEYARLRAEALRSAQAAGFNP